MSWTKWGPVLLSLLTSAFGWAQSSEISKDFGGERRSTGDRAYESLQRSLSNRTLARGLAQGVANLNQTVDSLLQSLFYSVMDQDLRYGLTENLDLALNMRRDVYPALLGQFVVVDTFRLGPRFLRDLGRVRGLPLTFQNQSQIFVTNASLRSDALRKSEAAMGPVWREILNNWLGVLPVLTRILPPSFNPEELHDPLSYLQTPFLFPRSVEEALDMPIGNVRSYGLSSTNSLGLDAKGRSLQDWQDSLRLSDLDLAFPLTVFHGGEHRISVMRRDRQVLWLALSEVRRIGQGAGIDLKKSYQVFQKVFNGWGGIPVPIAPFDFDLQRARNVRLDELYSFDLSQTLAQEAFNLALQGNLTQARSIVQADRHAESNSGIRFLFRRLSSQKEDQLQKTHGFYVAQSQHEEQYHAGESRTVDPQGEFLSLDVEQQVDDRQWNVLVGEENLELRHRLSIPVRKEQSQGRPGRFRLDISEEHPLYLTASLRVIDNFVDTRELQQIYQLLRNYSGLALQELPVIPIYAQDVRRGFIARHALANPMEEISRQELTPTYLGRISCFSHLYFAHELVLELTRKKPEDIWAAVALAFETDPNYWREQGPPGGLSRLLNRLGSIAVRPFEFLNKNISYPHIARESERLTQAFLHLQQAREAKELQAAYQQLLDTSHPIPLIRALQHLARGKPLPILVGCNAEAKRSKQDSSDTRMAKDNFVKLEGQVFSSPWPVPPIKRDQSIEEKLASFHPSHLNSQKGLPSLSRLTLSLDQNDNRTLDAGRLLAELSVRPNGDSVNELKVYVRVEQHGAINLGRFVLAEQIFSLRALALEDSPQLDQGVSRFRLPLNGSDGLRNSAFFDQAMLSGGDFDLIVSLSGDGERWSSEQSLSFTIENGLLRKL